MTSISKVNLGSGPNPISGWTNVDYAIGARLARIPVLGRLVKMSGVFNCDWDPSIVIANLAKRFPWADGTISVVYSSHTLEHFSKSEGHAFLSECHRILKPGGIIRIVVPDLDVLVQNYREGNLEAEDFVDKLDVLYENQGGFLKRLLCPYIQFPHRCMYDHAALVRVMSGIGFDAAPRTAFDSDIDDIRNVELENRTIHSVVVEGRKPLDG